MNKRAKRILVLFISALFANGSWCMADEVQTAPAPASMSIERQYERDLIRFEKFYDVSDRSLDAFTNLIQQVRTEWVNKDKESYLLLMLKACQMLVSLDFGSSKDKASDMGHAYALELLKSTHDLPLGIETRLIGCLPVQFDQSKIKAEDWIELRSDMTKLRLRAVKRIDTELDPNFSLSNGFMPSVNVMPPLGSGVMPGRPPSEVKDPKLRAIYEEDRAKNRKRILEIRQQLELKQLNRSFSPATEKHIISAYSQPPYNTEELKHYLDLYEIDKERKDRILKGVEVAIQNNKS